MSVLKELVLKNRSYRRFDEKFQVSPEILMELIDLARITPSARNAQPLKYIISYTAESNRLIFPSLAWAAYLKNWNGPAEGERPTAYIVVLLDKNISENPFCDHGITAQTILLGAVEKGLGGCIIMSLKKDKLKEDLQISDQYEILMVIALGKPAEKIVLEPIPKNGDFRYWRDEADTHHVPKRSLEEIVVKKI